MGKGHSDPSPGSPKTQISNFSPTSTALDRNSRYRSQPLVSTQVHCPGRSTTNILCRKIVSRIPEVCTPKLERKLYNHHPPPPDDDGCGRPTERHVGSTRERQLLSEAPDTESGYRECEPNVRPKDTPSHTGPLSRLPNLLDGPSFPFPQPEVSARPDPHGGSSPCTLDHQCRTRRPKCGGFRNKGVDSLPVCASSILFHTATVRRKSPRRVLRESNTFGRGE